MEQLCLNEVVSSLPVSIDEMEAEARRRRYYGRRKAAVDAIEAETEQLGLVFEVRKRRGRPKGSVKEPDRNDLTWSEENVLLVMDGLLHQITKAFDRETSEKERDTILAWVAAPAEDENPFSFRKCCGAFGYDPDYLQRAILHYADCEKSEPEIAVH